MKRTLTILMAVVGLTIANTYANEAQLVAALKKAGIAHNGVITVTDQNKDLVLRLIRKYAPERLPGVQREMSSWQYLNPGWGSCIHSNRTWIDTIPQPESIRFQ
jgi:hypothetical protein